MSNYSLLINTHVKETNAAAVINGAESFIGSGGASTNTTQTEFNDITQDDTVTITHTASTSGILIQVYELKPVTGLYTLQDSTAYSISNKSDTVTTITKISAGTADIKVNVLLS